MTKREAHTLRIEHPRRSIEIIAEVAQSQILPIFQTIAGPELADCPVLVLMRPA